MKRIIKGSSGMRQKKEPIPKFNREGLKALQVFTNQLNFSIAVVAYSEWQEQQISCMCLHYESLKMKSEEICRWCITPGIKYQIINPLVILVDLYCVIL